MPDAEPQNIYDDPAFFAGYATLERFGAGWERAVELGDLLGLLPEVAERRELVRARGAQDPSHAGHAAQRPRGRRLRGRARAGAGAGRVVAPGASAVAGRAPPAGVPARPRAQALSRSVLRSAARVFPD